MENLLTRSKNVIHHKSATEIHFPAFKKWPLNNNATEIHNGNSVPCSSKKINKRMHHQYVRSVYWFLA